MVAPIRVPSWHSSGQGPSTRRGSTPTGDQIAGAVDRPLYQTGCSTVAVWEDPTAMPHLTFYLQIARKRRADERTRTAYPCSLRVISQVLQGYAGDCKCRISRGVSLPCFAECCTVLRSRWYQSGVRTSDSYRRTAGPMARPRDLRSHNSCDVVPVRPHVSVQSAHLQVFWGSGWWLVHCVLVRISPVAVRSRRDLHVAQDVTPRPAVDDRRAGPVGVLRRESAAHRVQATDRDHRDDAPRARHRTHPRQPQLRERFFLTESLWNLTAR